MENQIKQILNELYENDSSLKIKETELEKIISRMIEIKPSIKIDNNFKQELKQKIIKISEKNQKFNFNNFFKFLWIFFSWAIAFWLVINIFPDIFIFNKTDNNQIFNNQEISSFSADSIEYIEPNLKISSRTMMLADDFNTSEINNDFVAKSEEIIIIKNININSIFMAYILIIIYFFLLLSFYIFIIKRMKNISYRHMKNTQIESLGRWYTIIKKRIFFVFLILFIISSFLILTFFDNALFYKIWLYDNKETLDSNAF